MSSETQDPGLVGATQPAPCKPPQPGMVWIPGGSFRMGSNDHYPEEAPVHRVTVDGFWMDKYPVTNTRFARFVRETGYVTVAERPPDPELYPGAPPENLVPGSLVFRKTKGRVDLRYVNQWWAWTPGACWRRPEGPGSHIIKRQRHPVVHIAYKDALAYAEWAGKALPTEAEWEYAARALSSTVYSFGDDESRLAEYAWYNRNSRVGTHPVGRLRPNAWGLYDMHGNVWEWVQDRYGRDYYEQSPTRNPQGSVVGASRVVRGGGWLVGAWNCRAAIRYYHAPVYRGYDLGFRLARSVALGP